MLVVVVFVVVVFFVCVMVVVAFVVIFTIILRQEVFTPHRSEPRGDVSTKEHMITNSPWWQG